MRELERGPLACARGPNAALRWYAQSVPRPSGSGAVGSRDLHRSLTVVVLGLCVPDPPERSSNARVKRRGR